MEFVLTAALVIGAIGVVWAASLLGFVSVVVALIFSLGALIFVILRQRAAKSDEHLYDRSPVVVPIRKPLTPMEYSYRSNLDIPFFSFESQNYGKKTPRKRVRGIPIDRFFELQEKIDGLNTTISDLLGKLQSARVGDTKLDDVGSDKFIFVYPPAAAEPEFSAKTIEASPLFTAPKVKPKKRFFMPSPEETSNVESQPQARRFRKSRAGDPWDSASHWGWR
jgi:hypothetical protein